MTAQPPRSGSYKSLSATGFHRLSYTEWGPSEAGDVVLCVHGLTRNGRDFDPLAQALAEDRHRVVCPDVVGRGRSAWLADPQGYLYPQYLGDATALIARLGVESLDWVGTSMGGLMGMMLAAQPETPLRRLVINDVGPLVPKAALERIGDYVGGNPFFEDLAGLEAYLRKVHAPFGSLTDGQWRHLAEHGARLDGKGYRLAYDPGIAAPFKGAALDDIDLWEVWDRIEIPVLVLRGEVSDLLLAETAEEMAERGPKAKIVTVADCGHAPALMDPAQIGIIRDWLSAG